MTFEDDFPSIVKKYNGFNSKKKLWKYINISLKELQETCIDRQIMQEALCYIEEQSLGMESYDFGDLQKILEKIRKRLCLK